MWTPLPLSPTAGFAFPALSHAAVELDLELATSTPLPVSPLAASPDIDLDLTLPMWIPLPLLPMIEPVELDLDLDLQHLLLSRHPSCKSISTPLPVTPLIASPDVSPLARLFVVLPLPLVWLVPTYQGVRNGKQTARDTSGLHVPVPGRGITMASIHLSPSCLTTS